MFKMKRFFHLMLAVMMLLSCIQVPSAYAADTPTTVTVNVTNTPVRGDIVLEKSGMQLVRFADEKDAYGNTVMKPIYQNSYLAGAVFELHAAENIVGKEGTTFYKKDELVEKLTTSGTGAVKSKVLPLGKYYLKEISAPEGYVFDSAPYNVTLSAIDKKTAVVEVKVSASNTYLPIRVTLRKEKENLKLLTDMESGSRWNPTDGAELRNSQRTDLLDLMTGTQRKEHLTGSDGYNSYDLTYEVPFIRMDSYAARSYNAMLRREIYPYIDDAKAALDQGYSPWLYGVDYKAYVWKNTLTVLTWFRGDWGINIYYPITLDLDTGEKLGNEEIAALYGMDPQEMKTAVRESMRAYYENAYAGAKENAGSFYISQLEKTIDSSNTDKAVLYPTADGTPYLACTIYSLAGADSYDYCILLQK